MTISPPLPPTLPWLLGRSVATIEANQAPSGAYVASPSFRVYRYSWFRDGAFIADAMSAAGRRASADAFFAWCAGVLSRRTDRLEEQVARAAAGVHVPTEELLHTRYTLDGDEATDAWWNFQLDGYGTWLWAMDAHAGRSADPAAALAPYARGADLCVRYLCAFWERPSFDWWEEHGEHRHTSTLAALYGGLGRAAGWPVLPEPTRAAARATAARIRDEVLRRGVHAGRFAKWLGGDGLDASLVACATPFRLVAPDDPLMEATVAAIRSRLTGPGVHRHPADDYFGGGQWPVLAGLLGWHDVEAGRPGDARALLEWIVAQATASGELPEQVGPLLRPEAHAGWEERWGPVALPLLWSHAMLLRLALALGVAEPPVEAQA